MNGAQSCAREWNFGFEILKFQSAPDALSHIFYSVVAVRRAAECDRRRCDI